MKPGMFTGPVRVLGIETSCDETAAAIVAGGPGGPEICSNIVFSQVKDHAVFGGVVPEIAARAHVEILDQVIVAALHEAHMELRDIDAIAATAGPGLIGGLLVGVSTGRALAAALDKPFVPINHLEGHALTARLTHQVTFPYVLLLVSGGHTQVLLVEGVGNYTRWGSTIDDALGEAFDKTAKLLGLGYPGGPEVERWARDGDKRRFALPRPLLRRETLDFSFAGLKTALRINAEKTVPLTNEDIADLCASFQAAVCDVLVNRLERALARFRRVCPGSSPQVVVAGGVAANAAINQALAQIAEQAGARLIVPPASLCADNGAMIAWAARERLVAGIPTSAALTARARWPLDEDAAPIIGGGGKVKV